MSQYETLRGAWSYASGVAAHWDNTLSDERFQKLPASVQEAYISHLGEGIRHLNECLGIMQRAGMDKGLPATKHVVTPERVQTAVERARQSVPEKPKTDKPTDVTHLINPGG